MNKLGLLLKVQLLNSFGFNKAKYSKDPKDQRKFTGFVILMAFVILIMLFYVSGYSVIMAMQLSQFGGDALKVLPALMMAAASIMTLFTTIYKVNGILFGFKDYDMTMALPVRTEIIVASRLLEVYLINAGFCAFFTIPSGIVYGIFAHPSGWFYPLLILLTLFVPMVPMIIGTALGSVVTAISSRFRRMNIVNLILSIVVLSGVMVIAFNAQTVMTNAASIGITLLNTVDGIYPLTKMYRTALCGGNWISLFGFVVISLGLFLAFCLLTGKYFKKINTALTTSRSNSNYKMTTLKTSKPLQALYYRELHRYFASSLYVLNTGIGMVLAVLMCVALFFIKPDQLEQMMEMPGFASVISDLSPLVLSVFTAMTCTTACSISLEGKSIWLLKSLPVGSDMIFLAKGLLNLTVSVPISLICSCLLAVVIPMNAVQFLFLLITPVAYAVLITEVGLLLNLLSPNFEWASEVVVIKQSMPTMVAILGGMAIAIAPLFVFAMAVPDTFRIVAVAVLTAVIALIDGLLYRVLKTKGARMFRAL